MSEFDHLEFVETQVGAILAAQVKGECGMDPASMGPAISRAFETLGQYLGAQAVAPAGPPRTIYTDSDGDRMTFIVAMPIAAAPSEPAAGDGTFVGEIGGGKVYRFTHRGSYAALAGTYGEITAFLKAKGLMPSEADWARFMPMWEEYLNDPETTPEGDLLTYIYLPAA